MGDSREFEEFILQETNEFKFFYFSPGHAKHILEHFTDTTITKNFISLRNSVGPVLLIDSQTMQLMLSNYDDIELLLNTMDRELQNNLGTVRFYNEIGRPSELKGSYDIAKSQIFYLLKLKELLLSNPSENFVHRYIKIEAIIDGARSFLEIEDLRSLP